MNDDGDFLLLSGIEHFIYCRRQWALIHVERQWQENSLTLEGNYLHERVHDADFTEKRGSVLLSRGMPVRSAELRVTGSCDMVEMTEDPSGVPIQGREGRWRLYPVEYKRGRADKGGSAAMQLCAQAMCLEEMFVTYIPEGAVYSAAEHRRHTVAFTSDMRDKVRATVSEMRQYFDRGYTPKSKKKPGCKSCSLREICQVDLLHGGSALDYFKHMLAEEDASCDDC